MPLSFQKLPILKLILKNAWNVSWGLQIFLILRWLLTPYTWIGTHLHLQECKRVLDLGCGHGLFSMFLASQFKDLQVIGLDHDGARVQAAKKAAAQFQNLNLVQGDLTSSPLDHGIFDAIFVIDVMHYFSYEAQKLIVERLDGVLDKASGVLLIRELAQEKNFSYFINLVYEKSATFFGFTKSANKDEIYLRSKEGWKGFLQELGFEVQTVPCGSFIFNDYLFIAKKAVSKL